MALLNAKIDREMLEIEFRDTTSRNSFSIRAAEELKAVCETYKGRYRALIFRAPGRVFCSGGNLADYAAMTAAEPGCDVNRRIATILDDFSRLAVPTICLVTGDCFGGGTELISVFDVVLSVPYAMFGFWQRKVGLTFGWGGGARLEKRLGTHRLRQLALAGKAFGALEAERIGLIDRVCIEGRLDEEARAYAERLIALPSAPVAEIKELTADNERASFERLWWNEEHRSALFSRAKPGGK